VELFSRTCKSEQMNFQRILARFLLICGIAFTFWMGFGNQYAYQGQPLAVAAAYGLLFSGFLIIVFVLGLFFENLAALLLGLGALGIVVWGSIAGWTGGAWGAMAFLLALPMVISAIMYASAASMQKICNMQSES
jgi:hypothetical protein